MAIRWKNTGTDRKKKQTVPGGATVQIGDIRQGAELPVEKPSYQLMGAQQPAAAQRASAQAAQTNGQRAAVQSSAPSTQSSGRQVGYDPGGNQAYQEALRRMQETE